MSEPSEIPRRPCVMCAVPWEWRHHVAGRANFPEVIVDVCQRHAGFLDEFLRNAGVNLKHAGERTDGELVWAAVAGLDALRAARDGRRGLSREAVEFGRLIPVLDGEARVRRDPTRSRAAQPHSKPPPGAVLPLANAAIVTGVGELLAALPGAAERLPRLADVFGRLARLPPDLVAETLRALDEHPEIIRHTEYVNQDAVIELLGTWRAAEAGDPDAQVALEPIATQFAETVRLVLGLIEDALAEREEVS